MRPLLTTVFLAIRTQQRRRLRPLRLTATVPLPAGKHVPST